MVAPLAERAALLVGNQLLLLVEQEHLVLLVVGKAQAVPRFVDLVLGLVVDHRFDHRDRRGIEWAFGAADLADDLFDFGDSPDQHVLLLQHLERLADRGVGHRHRHQQKRALVERRHELIAETRQGMRSAHPGLPRLHVFRGQLVLAGDRFGQNGLNAGDDFRDRLGKRARHRLEAEPHRKAKHHQRKRHEQEQELVRQAPAQDRLVAPNQQLETKQHTAEQSKGEHEVAGFVGWTKRLPKRREQDGDQDRDAETRSAQHKVAHTRRHPRFDETPATKNQERQAHPPIHKHCGNNATGDQEQRKPMRAAQATVIAAPQKQVRRRRNDDQRNDDRCKQRKGLGVGQRFEQLAFGAFHRKDGQETHDRCQHGGHDCAGDFGRAAVDALKAIAHGLVRLDVLENVFGEHDAHIDHRANRDRDARQRDDVSVDAKVLHRDKANQHGKRQQARNQRRATEVPDHHEHDDDRDQDFVFERIVQRAERLVDQTGAIVKGHDRDPRLAPVRQLFARQTGGDLGDLGLDAVDDLEWIRAIAHDDHPADGLRAALVERSTPQRRPKGDCSDFTNRDRHVVRRADDCVFDVLERLNQAEAAHHVLGAVDFDRARADVDVRLLHSLEHLVQRNAVGAQSVWVDVDLVFLHVAADRSDFGDAVNTR